MIKLLILFVVMNIVNVIIQTIKSIATIKCGKGAAAAVNAVAYGLYTYIVVLTMCDLPLLAKCLIVALCNFIGVYVVKYFEQKARKDKLWKIEATIPTKYTEAVHFDLNNLFIPNNYIPNVGKYSIFNIYCATQADSIRAKNIIDQYGAKYFVSETKIL